MAFDCFNSGNDSDQSLDIPDDRYDEDSYLPLPIDRPFTAAEVTIEELSPEEFNETVYNSPRCFLDANLERFKKIVYEMNDLLKGRCSAETAKKYLTLGKDVTIGVGRFIRKDLDPQSWLNGSDPLGWAYAATLSKDMANLIITDASVASLIASGKLPVNEKASMLLRELPILPKTIVNGYADAVKKGNISLENAFFMTKELMKTNEAILESSSTENLEVWFDICVKEWSQEKLNEFLLKTFDVQTGNANRSRECRWFEVFTQKKGEMSVVKSLLEAGADPHCFNEMGETPLRLLNQIAHQKTGYGSEDDLKATITLLFKFGATVDDIQIQKTDPMSIATPAFRDLIWSKLEQERFETDLPQLPSKKAIKRL